MITSSCVEQSPRKEGAVYSAPERKRFDSSINVSTAVNMSPQYVPEPPVSATSAVYRVLSSWFCVRVSKSLCSGSLLVMCEMFHEFFRKKCVIVKFCV
jgi:hypothetical protein